MKDEESGEFYDKYVKAKRNCRIFAALFLIVSAVFAYGTVTFFTCDEIKEQHCWLNLRRQHSIEREKLSHNGGVVENQHNAAGRLDFGEESEQVYHPKVINFAEPWHGYKYWMVYSLYSYGNDEHENPYLRASNDLIHWEVPKGLTNPIEETPKNYQKNKVYNADPYLVYNNDTDTMEIYWRYINDIDDEVIVYRKTSQDGVNWSEKTEILKAMHSKNDYITPAIVYDNGIYKWWYVSRSRSLVYMESEDNVEFTDPKNIKLEYAIAQVTNWHIDVIKTGDQYDLVMAGYNNWADRNSMNLYYFNSRDGIEWYDGGVILRPSISSWDNRGVDRGSLIKENGIYYVYYTGISTDMQYGVGMSYGENIHDLVGSDPTKTEE